MSSEVKTAVKELNFGEFDFSTMKGDDLDRILSQLVDNYDPEIDSVKRKRITAYNICKRNKIESVDAISKYLTDRAATLLKEVPEEFHFLMDEDDETLFGYLKKAGARIQRDLYEMSSRHDRMKLVRRLVKRIAEEHEGMSLEQFIALPITKGRGGRVLKIVYDINNMPTLRPNGISANVQDIIRTIAASHGIAQVGRSVGKFAVAVIALDDEFETRIRIQMPDEYIIETGETDETEDVTAAVET